MGAGRKSAVAFFVWWLLLVWKGEWGRCSQGGHQAQQQRVAVWRVCTNLPCPRVVAPPSPYRRHNRQLLGMSRDDMMIKVGLCCNALRVPDAVARLFWFCGASRGVGYWLAAPSRTHPSPTHSPYPTPPYPRPALQMVTKTLSR